MGFNANALSDYTKRATEILRTVALFSEDFSEFSLQDDIKYKDLIDYVSAKVEFQSGGCDLPVGSIGATITEKEIETKLIGIKEKYCYKDLIKKGLDETQLAIQLTNELTDDIKVKIADTLWNGNDSLAIDGWLDHIYAATGETISAEFDTALDVDNVDNAILAMIDHQSDAMKARGVNTIYVSKSIFRLYKNNRLRANYYRDQDADLGKDEMWVFGYEGEFKLKMTPELKGIDDMIMTWSKNLLRGVDEVSDVSSSEWVNDPIGKSVYFMAEFSLGTQVYFSNEVVVLRTIA